MPKAEKKVVEPAFEPEKTVTKTLNLGGRQGLPMRVDVKNGRIIRIRPLHFDEKYSLEHIKPWKIEARGEDYKTNLHAASNRLNSSTILVRPSLPNNCSIRARPPHRENGGWLNKRISILSPASTRDFRRRSICACSGLMLCECSATQVLKTRSMRS